MNLPVTSFWEYSNAVYHKPGVERALLTLQQRLGVDVNVVLFCLWLAQHRHRGIEVSGLAALIAQTSVWQHQTVRPLRRLRQHLKGSADGMPRDEVQALRERVQELEMQAEHIEQNYLESAAPHHAAPIAAAADRTGVAVRNIAEYFRFLGVEPDLHGAEPLMNLLSTLLNIPSDSARNWWRVATRPARSVGL